MESPPFSAMAAVYDEIMADVEYGAWCRFLLGVAGSRGYPAGPVLDLGCGTGTFTLLLAEHGLSTTGLDSSDAMLAVARAKAPGMDWRAGNLTSFSLPGCYGMAVAVFDTMNNLLEPADFVAAARRVRHHLLPGGLFVFDVNTGVGLRDLWEGGIVEGWAGNVFYRWVHRFDEARGLARVDAYCDDGTSPFTEVHYERPYEAGEVTYLLTEAGFEAVETLSYPTAAPAESDAERIWVCARAPAA